MKLLRDPLTAAWLWLVGLSLASSAAALALEAGAPARVTGALVLAFATLKARLILDRYLGLAAAPFWRRGFAWALAGFALLLLGLFLIA